MNQEDEDELFRTVFRTEHECAACAETLHYTDEVALITVVSPTIESGNFFYRTVLVEDGDFLYEPRFVCFTCWEDTANELGEIVEDIPPIEEITAVLLCKLCKSGICLDEYMGLVTMGELQCSQRSPDGTPTTIFDAQDPDPVVLCISCLKKLSDTSLNLWTEVDQLGECEEGTEIRCWRHGCVGPEGCMLKCHKE